MDQRTRVRTARVAAALLLVGGLVAGCTGDGGAGGGVRGRPGAAGVRDPYFPKLGNGGYDVRSYALTLDYEPRTGHLTGTADITARATQDLSAFNLDLAGLTVTGATVDGAEAAVNRAGSELTLRPAAELTDGHTFRTVVRYSGAPGTITDPDKSQEGWFRTPDGAVALGEPTGSMAWFPGNHHPGDKAAFRVSVTVPAGLQALSNGELAEQRTRNGRTTFVWRSAEPMATYLATLAIGHYQVRESRTPAGLPVRTAVREGAATRQTAPLLARIPELTAWEEENFGPYPFSSTGAIVDPAVDTGYALETQTRPFFPVGTFDTATLVHELAHQWYGDSVSPKSWRDMWLNEGFATYAEWLYDEDFGDKPAGESFQEAFEDDAAWEFPPAEPPGPEVLSETPVYRRGAMVLHQVREAVGDEAFFRLLKGWPADHRGGNASTEDFTRYAERTTGKDLSAVWEVWLYGDERPEEPDGADGS